MAELADLRQRLATFDPAKTEAVDGVSAPLYNGQTRYETTKNPETQLRPGGTQRWVLTNKTPLQDRQGQFIEPVGMSCDITEHKQLEQRRLQSLDRRSRQVSLSVQVAQHIVATNNFSDLARRAVTLLKEYFGFYHAQLFQYNSQANTLSLVAGYGKVGVQMVADHYQLDTGDGPVGLAAVMGTPVLYSDVTRLANWRSHPLLPKVKSQLAVPLKLGHQDAQIQVDALQYFIDHNFAGFIVCIIDPVVVTPIIQAARHKGLHVVCQSEDLGLENQTAFVGIKEYQAGYMLGTQAGAWAKTHVAAEETLELALINYRVLPQLQQREQGIVDGLKAAFGPNVNIVANETAADPVSAAPIAQRWLQTYPNLKMIIGINDSTALGAYQVVVAAGKNDPEQFFIGGIDAIDEALNAIKEGGAFQATVDYPPRETGIVAVRTLLSAIIGAPYPKSTIIQSTPVNRFNLDRFIGHRQAKNLEQNFTLPGEIPAKRLKIGLSVINLNNPFFVAMAEAAQHEAERLGVELVISDPRQVLGVLTVQSALINGLDTEDQFALEGLTAQLAAAMESDRLRQGLEQRVAERTAELLEANLNLKEHIAERQQAEAIRVKLEEQLRQAQKMEAVGRLAGGIAHDFNNLLTVINGYSNLLLSNFPQDHPAQPDLEQIKKAGERAAALTRQLLTFSRRQVPQPEAVNLNAIVRNLEGMLQRLIGEDIDLTITLEPTLALTMADPGQVEQIIVNLAVNARDAMPHGGKLKIETRNLQLAGDYDQEHIGLKPGPYIGLQVSDTGLGMDSATQERIFEPFFTTKEVGKGTGLGLATVYGIVQQSGGYITVCSELQKGTIFEIYLPQIQHSANSTEEIFLAPQALAGSETILLVEDDQSVRRVARRCLEKGGYVVLEARHGLEAWQLCQNHPGPIHLLITDIVMPDMNGPELAQRVVGLFPQLPVLFMSGYNHHYSLQQNLPHTMAAWIHKPFTAADLTRKVRELLDSLPDLSARLS